MQFYKSMKYSLALRRKKDVEKWFLLNF